MKVLTTAAVCIGVLYVLDSYFFNGMYFNAAYEILARLISALRER